LIRRCKVCPRIIGQTDCFRGWWTIHFAQDHQPSRRHN
jgi:hypothetical protein